MRPSRTIASGLPILPAISLILGACVDAPSVVAPLPSSPNAEILDGAHNAGNAHFFFLPPLVGQPTSHGTPDATLNPDVWVCEWASAGCGVTVAHFNVTAGTGSVVVGYSAGQQQYNVNWKTDVCEWGACTLDPAKIYRLRVNIGSLELGHADLQVFANASQAKNLQTNETIALVDGRTLPVRFRIENGIASSIEVTPNPATVPIGQTLQMTATVRDMHGGVISGAVVTWASGNAALATVNLSGLVSGIAGGCTAVTATSSGVQGSAALTVTPVDADFLFFDGNRPPVDGSTYLYGGRIDGCVAPHRVSPTPVELLGLGQSPEISHDGQWVAFFGRQDLKIHVVRVDGTNERTIDTGALQPFWMSMSPDGSQIAFVAQHFQACPTALGGQRFNVFAIRADGTNLRQLTDEPCPDPDQTTLFQYSNGYVRVRWSPTGTRLAISHLFEWRTPTESFGSAAIELINPDGTGLIQVTPLANGRVAEFPEWFQDGSRFAFVDITDASIWVAPLNGGAPQQLTTSQGQLQAELRVSWDGTAVAFMLNTCGAQGLATVGTSGGTPRLLTCPHDPQFIYPWSTPAWRHDGGELLYARRDRNDIPRLYAITSDGAAIRSLGTGYWPAVIP